MYYSEYYFIVFLRIRHQNNTFAVTPEVVTLLIQNFIARNNSEPFPPTFSRLFTWDLSYCYPSYCFLDKWSVPIGPNIDFVSSVGFLLSVLLFLPISTKSILLLQQFPVSCWSRTVSPGVFVPCLSLNVFQRLMLLKSRRMRGAGHVARMGEGRDVYSVLAGKPVGKRRLGDPGVDGRIILRWISRKLDVGLWTGSSSLRIGIGSGHFWLL
jgi:hypothetical protein